MLSWCEAGLPDLQAGAWPPDLKTALKHCVLGTDAPLCVYFVVRKTPVTRIYHKQLWYYCVHVQTVTPVTCTQYADHSHGTACGASMIATVVCLSRNVCVHVKVVW